MSFTGDTVVSLDHGISQLWRTSYTGEVIRLIFGSEDIGVTKDQKVLTPNGWRSAELLRPGDELCCIPQQDVLGCGPGQVLVPINDLCRALIHHAYVINRHECQGEGKSTVDEIIVDLDLSGALQAAFFRECTSALDVTLVTLDDRVVRPMSGYVYDMWNGLGHFGVAVVSQATKANDTTRAWPMLAVYGHTPALAESNGVLAK